MYCNPHLLPGRNKCFGWSSHSIFCACLRNGKRDHCKLGATMLQIAWIGRVGVGDLATKQDGRAQAEGLSAETIKKMEFIMKSNLNERAAPLNARFEGGKSSGDFSPESDTMQKVLAAGTPGAAHHVLNSLLGEWKCEVKCWNDPSGEPDASQGTASAAWKFDGRFLVEEFHGQMMGKEFKGETLLGYDNTKKKYQSVWIADTATSMFVSEGRSDATHKVITFEGEASCAVSGKTNIPMKTVIRLLSPEKHVLEMYDGSRGYAKTMEIIYERR